MMMLMSYERSTYMKSRRSDTGIQPMIFGVISCICFYFSRSLFDNPLDMVHKLSGRSLIPPIWLLNLISLVFFFFLGYLFGEVISETKRKINVGERELSVYKGAMFIICGFFLSLIWYPLLFIAQKLFFSLILSIIAMICLIACASEWRVVSPKGASIGIFVCSIFSFYQVLINLTAAFSN